MLIRYIKESFNTYCILHIFIKANDMQFQIPLSLRHDLSIASKRRICFYNIIDLETEILDKFRRKIINSYFSIKSKSLNPFTEIGKKTPPAISYEEYLCCSDGQEFYFPAEINDVKEIPSAFNIAGRIPLDVLAQMTIRKIKENNVFYENSHLERMKTSVILAFTGKKGAEYLKKVKFPGKTIFFAFICGEKEIGGSYLPDCYPICESEDMDGNEEKFLDLIKNRIAKINPSQNFAGDQLYLENHYPIKIREKICTGSEGVIYNTSLRNFLAKIYYEPFKNEKNIKDMLSNNVPLYGVSLPEEMLYDEHGDFQGFLMKNIRGVTLENVVYRPDYFYPESDIPRKNIILKFLRLVMFINSRNFYINDISLDNIIVDLKNRYMDIVFIDSERFSPDNELIQNMVLPEFIFQCQRHKKKMAFAR